MKGRGPKTQARAMTLQGPIMWVMLLNQLQLIGAAICFGEAARLPKNDPGPILTGVMGLLMLLKYAKATPQLTPLVLSRCLLVAIIVAGDEGMIDINRWGWTLTVLVAWIPAIFWPKILKLWKQPPE